MEYFSLPKIVEEKRIEDATKEFTICLGCNLFSPAKQVRTHPNLVSWAIVVPEASFLNPSKIIVSYTTAPVFSKLGLWNYASSSVVKSQNSFEYIHLLYIN